MKRAHSIMSSSCAASLHFLSPQILPSPSSSSSSSSSTIVSRKLNFSARPTNARLNNKQANKRSATGSGWQPTFAKWKQRQQLSIILMMTNRLNDCCQCFTASLVGATSDDSDIEKLVSLAAALRWLAEVAINWLANSWLTQVNNWRPRSEKGKNGVVVVGRCLLVVVAVVGVVVVVVCAALVRSFVCWKSLPVSSRSASVGWVAKLGAVSPP